MFRIRRLDLNSWDAVHLVSFNVKDDDVHQNGGSSAGQFNVTSDDDVHQNGDIVLPGSFNVRDDDVGQSWDIVLLGLTLGMMTLARVGT